jgi:hypothetical protein
MARVRSVPLTVRRAEVAALAEAEKAHLADCESGSGCPELRAIRAELKAGRAELASWFKPAADDARLF